MHCAKSNITLGRCRPVTAKPRRLEPVIAEAIYPPAPAFQLPVAGRATPLMSEQSGTTSPEQ